MSLILTDGQRIRFDLAHVLRERHLEVIPRDRDEFNPLVKKWYDDFKKHWAGKPIDTTAMDNDINKMLRSAVELGHLRHTF